MNAVFGRFVLILLVTWLSLSALSATGGPIDFLRRLGDSIAHPRHTQPARRTGRKNAAKPTRHDGDVATADRDSATSAKDIPAAVSSPKPPSAPAVARVAASVPPAQRSQADLPYGVPLPNKPGFVTSPYSPNGGYVDVRGYPSGIEVKDPYTGKIFLTP